MTTPSTGASRGRPKPGKAVGGSGCSQVRQRTGAVRPFSPTGTKSIAQELAKAVVPWLGTRSAGEFCTSQRPVKGKTSFNAAIACSWTKKSATGRIVHPDQRHHPLCSGDRI